MFHPSFHRRCHLTFRPPLRPPLLKVFLETIQNHRVTKAFIVPPIAVFLAKHPLVKQARHRLVVAALSGKSASWQHEWDRAAVA